MELMIEFLVSYKLYLMCLDRQFPDICFGWFPNWQLRHSRKWHANDLFLLFNIFSYKLADNFTSLGPSITSRTHTGLTSLKGWALQGPIYTCHNKCFVFNACNLTSFCLHLATYIHFHWHRPNCSLPWLSQAACKSGSI